MPVFLVDIPPTHGKPSGLKAKVEAESWMVALAAGLVQLGFGHRSMRDVSADIREDGTVIVSDRTSGHVFRIREMRRKKTGFSAANVADKPIPMEPLAPMPKIAPHVAWKAYGAGSGDPSMTATEPGYKGSSKTAPGRVGAKPRTAPAKERGRPPARAAPVPSSPVGSVTLPPHLVDEIEQAVKRAAWTGLNAKSMDQILHVALHHIQAESGSAYLVNSKTGGLRICAAWGPRARRILEAGVELERGAGVAGFCVEQAVTLALSDVERDPRFHPKVAKALDYPVRAMLTSPIHSGKRAIGCLQLLNPRGATTFTALDTSILSLIASRAGEGYAAKG